MILDIWPGGSTLYGWDTPWGCIDRIPIMLEDREVAELLGIKVTETNVNIELLGNESDYISKLTRGGEVIIQKDLINQLKDKSLLPVNGMCAYVRRLITSVKAVKSFGELRIIDTCNSIIHQVPNEPLIIEGGSIVNSMPLDYIARIAGVARLKRELIKPPYITLYVTTILTRQDGEGVKVFILGKRRFKSIAMVSIPAKAVHPSLHDCLLTYIISATPAGTTDPSARQAALSDAKRLGIDLRRIIFMRSHYEKYGMLGIWDYAEELINELRERGITCVGRLGSWRELSIEEIVRELRVIK